MPTKQTRTDMWEVIFKDQTRRRYKTTPPKASPEEPEEPGCVVWFIVGLAVALFLYFRS